MSIIVNEISNYGIKSCFFMGKILGIASYNTVAYLGGFEPMLYFPPSKEDILIEEIKKIKQELVAIKTNIKDNLGKNQFQYQVIYINNLSLPIKEQDGYDLICIEEIIDTDTEQVNLIPYNVSYQQNNSYPLIEEID